MNFPTLCLNLHGYERMFLREPTTICVNPNWFYSCFSRAMSCGLCAICEITWFYPFEPAPLRHSSNEASMCIHKIIKLFARRCAKAQRTSNEM